MARCREFLGAIRTVWLRFSLECTDEIRLSGAPATSAFSHVKDNLGRLFSQALSSFAGMSDRSLFLLFNLTRIGKIIFCIIYFLLPVGINLGSSLRLVAVLITSNFCRARFSPLSRVCLRNAFDAFFVLLRASRILHVQCSLSAT